MNQILEVDGLTKHYKNFSLEEISFALPAGYIMGYVGQNGAGKTTTLNAITHLLKADAGESRVAGIRFSEDPICYREMLGYVGDASYFPVQLSARDIGRIQKDFYPTFQKERFEQYLEAWKLPAKKKIQEYSRGMKIRLMFACVLSRETKLLVLDEATNGLDPVMRQEILRLLQAYIDDGEHSVLFSTHIMEDLEQIADYVFFIDNGRKVFFEERESLQERFLLVKGGQAEMTAALRADLIGLRESPYGFEGLLDGEASAPLPEGVLAEKATIDQIVVHMIAQRQPGLSIDC